MKKILFMLFFILSFSFAENTTKQTEDINGFGNINFGEPIKKLKTYSVTSEETIKNGNTNYKQKFVVAQKLDEKLKIDNLKINKVEYMFVDDKLQQVTITVLNGMKNIDKIVETFSNKYGQFKYNNDTNSYFLNSENGAFIYISKAFIEGSKKESKDATIGIYAPVSPKNSSK